MLGFGYFGDEDLVFEDGDVFGGYCLGWVFGEEVGFVVSAGLLYFIVDEEGAKLGY